MRLRQMRPSKLTISLDEQSKKLWQLIDIWDETRGQTDKVRVCAEAGQILWEREAGAQ